MSLLWDIFVLFWNNCDRSVSIDKITFIGNLFSRFAHNHLSSQFTYCRRRKYPELCIQIKEWRHPFIRKITVGAWFVPTSLSSSLIRRMTNHCSFLRKLRCILYKQFSFSLFLRHQRRKFYKGFAFNCNRALAFCKVYVRLCVNQSNFRENLSQIQPFPSSCYFCCLIKSCFDISGKYMTVFHEGNDSLNWKLTTEGSIIFQVSYFSERRLQQLLRLPAIWQDRRANWNHKRQRLKVYDASEEL